MKTNLRNIFLVFLAVTMSACAAGIDLKETPSNQVGADNDEGVDSDFDHPFDDGDDDTQSLVCNPDEWRTENFSLDPDSVNGVNVVLLLDDSGSMTGEFQKVVYEIQDFINGITAATDSNYRIALIFDKDAPALSGRTFLDSNGNPIPGPNPFAAQIADPNVNYFEKETWSKWADLAFARVFMPANYMQTLPGIIPLDDPWQGSAITLDDCQGAGKYFRPRFRISNFYNTPGCVLAQDSYPIQNYLLSDITVNIVTVSDDDLNVNFDRANFDWDDPTKNAYPEIVDLMFKDLIAPLGSDVSYKYHSIVGLTSGNGVDVVGTSHMALSKQTQGARYSITLGDWAPLFDQLQEDIIFSEQKADLSCSPSNQVEVYFNDNLVDPQNYTVRVDLKRVELHPEAFELYSPDQSIAVKVKYRPRGD